MNTILSLGNRFGVAVVMAALCSSAWTVTADSTSTVYASQQSVYNAGIPFGTAGQVVPHDDLPHNYWYYETVRTSGVNQLGATPNTSLYMVQVTFFWVDANIYRRTVYTSGVDANNMRNRAPQLSVSYFNRDGTPFVGPPNPMWSSFQGPTYIVGNMPGTFP